MHPLQTDQTRLGFPRKNADLGGGVPGSPAAQRPATAGDMPAPQQAPSGQIEVSRQPGGATSFSGGRVSGAPTYDGTKAAGFRAGGGTVNSMSAENFASASPSADAAVGFARSAAVARGEPVPAAGGGFGFNPGAARAPQAEQPVVLGDGGGFGILSKEYQAKREMEEAMRKQPGESRADYATRVGAMTHLRGQDLDQQTAFRGQDVQTRGQDLTYDATTQGHGLGFTTNALDRASREKTEAARLGIDAGRLQLDNFKAMKERKDAPSGYRWTETGDLAAIPGGPGDRKVTDKLTEDQAKSAGYAARMANAMNLLDSIGKSNPDATRPGAGTALLNMLPESAANLLRNDDRQRVEAAQLDALDAALTLNTGAAYTREQLQGMQRSYFAQPGDSDQTVAEKQQRLANLMETARLRAGPQGSQMADAVVRAQKPAQATPNAPAVSPEIAELQRRAASNPALAQRLKEMGY